MLEVGGGGLGSEVPRKSGGRGVRGSKTVNGGMYYPNNGESNGTDNGKGNGTSRSF